MASDSFKPKPLEEILSPRPYNARKPVEWRGRPGEPKPLWAILGDEPPYDWQAETPATTAESLQRTTHGQFYMGPEPYTTPSTPLPDPVGPEACEEHYPPGSPERNICERTGTGDWTDCARACILDRLPEGWNPDDVERASPEYLKWLYDHLGCWTRCAVE